jgi:threonylcarbamoyladenosine tRNA methylthiotransferase MtaB
VEEVVEEVRSALGRGAKEVVLSGVQLAAWGKDLHDLPPSRRHLRALIETIMEQTAPPRLRLSSLEAWHLDKSFFTILKDKRICRHLHLPLQSGCNETLKRMGRRTRRESFAALMEDALQQCSDLAITTDIMVGFPGETEEEFAASLEFVKEMNFAGGHVFTYSERKGTPAAAFPNPVPISVRKERNALMRAVLLQSARRYRQRFVGTVRSVLWERAELLSKEKNSALLKTSAFNEFSAQAASASLGERGWRLEGLTDNYLRVKVLSSHNLWNEITEVMLDENNLFLEE